MGDGPNPFADRDEPSPRALEPSGRGASQAVRPRRRGGWTPPRILTVIAALAAASGAALALMLGGSASASSNETTLRGGAFTAAYPTGWTLKVTHPVAGINDYELTSNGGTLNEVGIPPAGDTGITIVESADATLAAEDPIAVPRDPLKLLPDVIGTPKAATSQATSVPLHATTLDGAAAAATSYTYTSNGVGDVQSDVVSHHGDEVASIELDIEPSLASQGTAALNMLLAQWHWTSQGIVVDPAALRYPPALQSRFLGSCERDGSTALCGCTLRYIEARVPLAAFAAAGAALEKGQIPTAPRWLTGAEKTCIDASPESAAPGGQTNSSGDAAAEELAHTAQVAIETLATDHDGSYATANDKPSALAAYEATIPIRPGSGNAYLSSVTAATNSYTVTTTSISGHTFSINRLNTGALTRTCTPRSATNAGCVNGSW
jgi:hypothetical protein